MKPWRPRPRALPPGLVLAACCLLLLIAGLTTFAAWSEWSQRREFDALIMNLDATRVTPEQIQAAVNQPRVGEEIRFQQPRPKSTWVVVPVTFYGEEYRGRPMAYGGTFDPDAFTCAHRDRRMRGKRVEFSLGERNIVLPVTDRGPWDRYPAGHPKAGQYRKEFDLSAAAFRVLSPDMAGGEGLPVRVRILEG